MTYIDLSVNIHSPSTNFKKENIEKSSTLNELAVTTFFRRCK